MNDGGLVYRQSLQAYGAFKGLEFSQSATMSDVVLHEQTLFLPKLQQF